MKKLKILLACLCVVSFGVFFFAKVWHSPGRAVASLNHSPDGEYDIVGHSSLNGDYEGHGWVKDNVVQRIVRYKTYSYQKNAVESVWSGKTNSGNFEFILKLSNTLTGFENYQASVEDLAPVTVTFPFTAEHLKNGVLDFSTTLNVEGTLSETWKRTKEASSTPMWTDLRNEKVGNGGKHPIITAIAKIAGLYKVIELYRELPQIKKYAEHPVFKSGDQIWISDKTDADFYAKTPGVLRITNKTINPLSLAEAVMRKNAYGHTLAWKADFLGKETFKNNMNAGGMLEVAGIDEAGNKTGGYPEGDSALWTGMYGWSEYLRYQTTKDPEALAHFKKVLEGTLTLIEIPGDVTQFARTLTVSPAEDNMGERWLQGKGQFSHLKWMTGGNNDMSKGVFITLALAHKIVREDEVELRTRIQNAVRHLSEVTTIKERSFNFAMAKGLDALWNKNEESLFTFQNKLINFSSFLSSITTLDNGLYIGGIADWSGIHLTMTSIMSQLFISEELIKVFPHHDVHFTKKILRKAQENLVELNEIYKDGHRDFVTIVAYAYAPDAHSSDAFKQKAREALWALKEIPAPRFVGNATIDLTKRSEWTYSAWPRQPWKALEGFRKPRADYDMFQLAQGAYAYPYFEGTAWNTTYFWKDIPFPMVFGSNKATKSFSSDYLMLYWVGRSSGLIGAEE